MPMRVRRHFFSNVQPGMLITPYNQTTKLLMRLLGLASLAFIMLANAAYVSAQGFQPSAAQIEQFKRLPKAEQVKLARSMGIDLKDFEGLLGSGASGSNAPKKEEVSGNRNSMRDEQRGQAEEIANDGSDEPTLEEDEGEAEAQKEELKLFGYDIFQFGADAFSPNNDIPIPSSYILGPGDSLVVQLYGKDNQTLELAIDRDGKIQFPSIGPVTLAGLTFSQGKEKINTIVSEQMIGVKASTTMGELRTIRVFVLGEANVPGSYVVGSLSTMTNALFASGGITEIGSLRDVQLKRGGKIITTLDLYDLLLNGDTSKDARIQPGDVIFIPPIGKTIGVSGEVKRPAVYEIKNERTVEDVIKLTGGLLPTAFVPASRIERITPAGEKTLVNIDVSTDNGRRYKVKDADVIQIFSTLDTMRDIIRLDGHVKRPGGFAWRQGLRFTDVIPSVDDMLPNPDVTVGLILREEKKTRKINVRLFSPIEAFSSPISNSDPRLESRDTVLLFDYESDRSEILDDVLKQLKTQSSFSQREQTAVVYGSVRFPGEYPITRGMTPKKLVELAGGLTESALGNDAEITRIRLDKNRQTSSDHIGVSLHSSPIMIEPGDTLRVKQVPLWNKKESVILSGEVLHPGTYPIIPGETLLDVISRAGGLTPHAYAEGAIFSREELRQLETERIDALTRQIESELASTNLTESIVKKGTDKAQTDQIIANMEAVRALGRMVIDLPSIMDTPQRFDFKVEDGDELEVPRFKPSVTVVGEVQYATSHFYNHKLSAFDYINRSGGTRAGADRKRVYIVKANGRVMLPKASSWFKNRNFNIEPGDTIVVPLDTNKVDKITLWSSITSIMSNAAIGIAAINNLR